MLFSAIMASKNKPSLLLFSLLFLLTCLLPNASSSSLVSKSPTVKDLCKSRPNSELCFDSRKLSISIGINPGILDFLLLTLQDALSEAGKLSGVLSGGQSGIVETQRSTMADCIELHQITLSLLKRSISDSGKISNPRNLADSRTYLSAALTNRETCLEGLESASGPSKPAILSSMDATYGHVSNALSMISQKSGKTVEKIHRRLMGFPTWISRRDLRILGGNSEDDYDGANVFTVAADGTGDFTTITDAINSASDYSSDRIIIRIMEGIYDENVEIPVSKTNIALIGEGSDTTIITGNRSVGDGWTTFRSATVGVHGDGFLARDITFQNTAGPQKHQAVALRVNADLIALYRCTFKGFQDTLYVHSCRQFYRECDIYGTVDYIFGNAQAVIQASNIISRLPMPGQFTVITAQGMNNESEPTGISIQNCSIIPTNDLDSAAGKVRSYLGRPWKQYATTVIMDSYIDGFISPEGWTPWSGDNDDRLSTLYYGEYNNNGPGSSTDGRVNWPGFHVMDHDEASRFTVSEFILGEEWLDSTLVPYDKGVS